MVAVDVVLAVDAAEDDVVVEILIEMVDEAAVVLVDVVIAVGVVVAFVVVVGYVVEHEADDVRVLVAVVNVVIAIVVP